MEGQFVMVDTLIRVTAAFPTSVPASPEDLYLNLLRDTLTRNIFADQWVRPVRFARTGRGRVLRALQRRFATRNVRMVQPVTTADWTHGETWPETAETMIGLDRMDNIRHCVETVLADRIPGDFIETGVWRGGGTIFMRGILAAHGITDRLVWAADSFEGLPAPTTAEDIEAASPDLSGDAYLKVDVDTVRANFARYGLLDDQVRFLVGWFKDTLPAAPLGDIAVMRLDGDLYESTWDAVTVLYPKLTPGGFVIVDDYQSWPGCRRAIDEYRDANGIAEPIVRIDNHGVYWRRENST